MPLSMDRAVADYAQAYTQPVPQTPAHEPKWPYIALAAGQGADVATTLAVNAQGGHETNPMGLAGTLAAKAALTPLIAYLMHRAAKQGDTTTQKILGTIGGIAGAIPAAMNARLIR